MKINCSRCGKEFDKKPYAVKAENYCSKECRHSAKYTVVACDECGKKTERHRSQLFENMFCSRKCAKVFTSARMTAMNEELNPDRMTPKTKEKLRKAQLKNAEEDGAIWYVKKYGRHEHRIVMEKMIGRKLRKGEVVHHEDRDKRNNSPENLKLFASQAEHAAWHTKERYPDEKA